MDSRKTDRDRIAGEVRAVMARRGIDVGQLAQALDINPLVLGRKLNGTSPIGLEEMRDIARALDMSPSELINAALVAAA